MCCGWAAAKNTREEAALKTRKTHSIQAYSTTTGSKRLHLELELLRWQTYGLEGAVARCAAAAGVHWPLGCLI